MQTEPIVKCPACKGEGILAGPRICPRCNGVALEPAPWWGKPFDYAASEAKGDDDEAAA